MTAEFCIACFTQLCDDRPMTGIVLATIRDDGSLYVIWEDIATTSEEIDTAIGECLNRLSDDHEGDYALHWSYSWPMVRSGSEYFKRIEVMAQATIDLMHKRKQPDQILGPVMPEWALLYLVLENAQRCAEATLRDDPPEWVKEQEYIE